MSRNRIAEPVVVAVGLMLLIAAPGWANTQNAQSVAANAPSAALPGQSKVTATLEDDFAGLNYTDEQKAAIDRIHRDSATHKAVVAKDADLTPDQKDAMLVGYTRMEYGMIFRVLTPEQQREVRKKIQTRKVAQQTARAKQLPQK